MTPRFLAALPVYNEVHSVIRVLDEVVRYADDILVVDDGSSDGTHELLNARNDILRIRHPVNRGYGAALESAFRFAAEYDYDVVVTLDCDGQHEPKRIPQFASACQAVDIVSGSRYLKHFEGDDLAPADRRRVNSTITRELNAILGLSLSDAFCGFKAYRVAALRQLSLTESGYAMPLELWVQAAHLGLRIREIAVPRVYPDLTRTFGGTLDVATDRLAYYREVIRNSMQRVGLAPKAVFCSDWHG